MALCAIGILLSASCSSSGPTASSSGPTADSGDSQELAPVASSATIQRVDEAYAPIDTTTSTHPTQQASPVLDGAYGDFSGQSYTMTDFVEVTTRTVECMNDLGFSVTVIPPGDGISYASVPPEQNAAAIAQSEECRRSMFVPEWSPPPTEELRIVYDYNVALNRCLAELGFITTPPPSFEEFQDTYVSGPWTAYFGSNVGSLDIDTRTRCPEVPNGGFSTWTVGDPIEPLQSGR